MEGLGGLRMGEFSRRLGEILGGLGFETNESQKRKLLETNEPIIVFGAGNAGMNCFDKLIDWGFCGKIVFCDNNKRGTKRGVEIISFDKLIADLHYSQSLIIIAIGTKGFPEVHKQLQENRISKARIIFRDYVCDKTSLAYMEANKENLKTIYDKLSDDLSREVFWKKVASALYCRINMDSVYEAGATQYMDSCCRLSGKEVFVDCGGYIGDTALQFIKRTNNHYAHIFAFEPEQENFKAMKENLRTYRNITIINKGLWDRETELRFNAGGGAASSVSSTGGFEIPVTCIDNLLETGYIPTFIKMDIEGSESMAILGAAKTIITYKPKLAICIYHKSTDVVEISILINELNPEYSYYLRQYESGFSWAETVLYAV